MSTSRDIADLALASARRAVGELTEALAKRTSDFDEDDVFDLLVPDPDSQDRTTRFTYSAALTLYIAARPKRGFDGSADSDRPVDPRVGYALLEAGDTPGALAVADDLTAELATTPSDDWNYGNLIHHVNVIRGKAHLVNGDLDQAAVELRAAAQTPGSPQLDTFGPDFALAWALLLEGRDDDVLAYLHGVSRFWAPDLYE